MTNLAKLTIARAAVPQGQYRRVARFADPEVMRIVKAVGSSSGAREIVKVKRGLYKISFDEGLTAYNKQHSGYQISNSWEGYIKGQKKLSPNYEAELIGGRAVAFRYKHRKGPKSAGWIEVSVDGPIVTVRHW